MWQVYKYFALNKNALTALSLRKLWASKPEAFNDPFEFRLKRSFDKGNISVLRKQNPHLSHLSDEDLFSQALAMYQSKINEMRVVCFSKVPNDILMWSHYADSHRGYVIGFKSINKSETLQDKGLHPVIYDKNYPDLNFERVWYADGLAKILFTKSKKWKHEKEVRLIQPEQKAGYVNYPGKLNKVIFGLRVKEQEIVLVKSILSNMRDIRYFKAELDEAKYKINLVGI